MIVQNERGCASEQLFNIVSNVGYFGGITLCLLMWYFITLQVLKWVEGGERKCG